MYIKAVSGPISGWLSSDVAVTDGYGGRGRRLRSRRSCRCRPLVLVGIDAEALVIVAPRYEELLEVRNAVELAVVQRERVHSVVRWGNVNFFFRFVLFVVHIIERKSAKYIPQDAIALQTPETLFVEDLVVCLDLFKGVDFLLAALAHVHAVCLHFLFQYFKW